MQEPLIWVSFETKGIGKRIWIIKDFLGQTEKAFVEWESPPWLRPFSHAITKCIRQYINLKIRNNIPLCFLVLVYVSVNSNWGHPPPPLPPSPPPPPHTYVMEKCENNDFVTVIASFHWWCCRVRLAGHLTQNLPKSRIPVSLPPGGGGGGGWGEGGCNWLIH